MQPYRVILHSMTFYRDFATLYSLSRLLERESCECVILSDEDYIGRFARAWNPDAIFYVTASRTDSLAKAFPHARFFYCAGEGGEDQSTFDEKSLLENTRRHERLETIYLWGRRTRSYIEEFKDLPGNEAIRESLAKCDKFLVVGAPRLDLVRFRLPLPAPRGELRVGFIGNCSYVNQVYNTHPLTRLMDYPDQHVLMRYSLDLMKFYVDVIQKLPAKNIRCSLRPYPLEPRKTYFDSELVRSGRLEIDTSVDFSTWLARQDVVIGDISSTVAPGILSGKKYLNVAKAVSRPESSYYFSLVDFFKKELDNVSPSTVQEMVDMIMDTDTMPTYSTSLLDLFDDMYDFRKNTSSIKAIVKDMLQKLRTKPPLPKGLSTRALKATTRLSNLLTSNSYSRIDHKAAKHEINTDLNPLINHLLNNHQLKLVGLKPAD